VFILNWKWWVGCQVAVIAWLCETLVPFSEAFFLSILWKLDRRIFWMYLSYDLVAYARSFGNTFSSVTLNFSKLSLNLNPVPGGRELSLLGWLLSTAVLIVGITILGFMIRNWYVRPIRFLVRLRRRILREILHVE
jgi:hypothetical protein